MFHEARIKCYNTQMNEVVYARVNNMVMAMKIVQYKIINNPKNGSLLHIAIFKCADGNFIEEMTSKMNDDVMKIYHTIEDCINGYNNIPLVWYSLNDTLTRLYNFDKVRTCVGYTEFGKIKFYWDGFNAKKLHIFYKCYDMLINEDSIEVTPNWAYNYNYGKYEKLFDSEEECHKHNFVKVVTF